MIVVVCAVLAFPIGEPRIPAIVYRTWLSQGGDKQPLDHVVWGIVHSAEKFNFETKVVTFASASEPLTQCGALDAFHTLIPYAYKSDLLRYCLIWLYGGWYADVMMNFVRDPSVYSNNNLVVAPDPGAPGGIWNGFFGAVQGHPALRQAIDAVIHNVGTCFYGVRDLEPTGTLLFGTVLKSYPDKLVLTAHLHGEIMHIGTPDLAHNKFKGYHKNYARMGYDKTRRSYAYYYNRHDIYKTCEY